MADRLHIPLIAEGVEAPEQAARLVTLGCDQGQGYLFSPPLPLDDLRRAGFLRRSPPMTQGRGRPARGPLRVT